MVGTAHQLVKYGREGLKLQQSGFRKADPTEGEKGLVNYIISELNALDDITSGKKRTFNNLKDWAGNQLPWPVVNSLVQALDEYKAAEGATKSEEELKAWKAGPSPRVPGVLLGAKVKQV